MRKLLRNLLVFSLVFIFTLSCFAAVPAAADGGHTHYAYCSNPDVCIYCGASASKDGITISYVYHSGNWVYGYNASSHWQYCDACGETSSEWNHYTYCSNPGVCAACGASESRDSITISYTYHEEWVSKHNADYHWSVCATCGEASDKYSHYAYCTDRETCASCGATVAGDGIKISDISHSSWTYDHDANYHWYVCETCGEDIYPDYRMTHTANSDLTACSTCGGLQKDIHMSFSDSASGYSGILHPNGQVSVSGKADASGTLKIPAKVAGYQVTGISANAFSRNSGLTKVTIPSAVKDIEPDAFGYQTVLNVVAGSAAETYAKEQGLQYTIQGETKTIQSGATTVNDKVNEIVANVITAGMTDYQKAIALHNYLIYNANYDTNYTYYHPEGVLLKGVGVCQSYTEAYSALLNKVGIENKYEYGNDHIWNLVNIGGKWCHVDVTWDDPVGGGYERTEYFAITDFALEGIRSHERYNKSANPASNSYKISYAYKNGELSDIAKTWRKQFEKQVNDGEYTVSVDSNSINRRMTYQMVEDKGITVNGYKLKPTMKYDASSGTATFTFSPIAVQPADAKASQAGGTVRTEVVPLGGELTYQWYVKNPGAETFSRSSVKTPYYSVKLTEAANGRQVYCVVTDKNGKKTKSAVATLSIGEPVEITKQPKSVKVEKAGETATATVKATGEGLTYQWYFRNASQTSYSKSSVTSATYSVRMTDANNGRRLYCIVTDKYGNKVQSNTIKFSIATALTITAQPVNAVAALGETASTSVEAAGDGLTYAWYIRNPGASSFGKSSVTSATYSMKMTEENNGRQAYCVVKDEYGNTVQSDTVTLIIGKKAKITGQPVSVMVASGATASATVKATGDGLTYTWYIRNPGASSFGKSSVTSATYSMKMSESVSGRQAYCVVKDKYGNTVQSDTVTLTMGNKAKITGQPGNAMAAAGETASTAVKATGDGLTYTWYIRNPGASSFGKSSVTSATYSMKMSAENSGRQAYCVVKDKYGNTVQSNTVTLTMGNVAKITGQPGSTMAAAGETASTTVRATGDGLTYTWYIRNPGASSFGKSSVTSATYSMKMSAENNGRQAYCVVKDKYGNTVQSNTVTLTMGNRAKITGQPGNASAAAGATAATTVKATGDGLTYTWYIRNPGASSFGKSSVTSATYSMKMSAENSGRQAYCIVRDQYGNTVQSNTVTFTVK